MFALELATGLLLGLGFFQRDDLGLGQHQAFLGALGFQRLEPLLHGLQVMTLPHASHASGRHGKPGGALLLPVANNNTCEPRQLILSACLPDAYPVTDALGFIKLLIEIMARPTGGADHVTKVRYFLKNLARPPSI